MSTLLRSDLFWDQVVVDVDSEEGHPDIHDKTYTTRLPILDPNRTFGVRASAQLQG